MPVSNFTAGDVLTAANMNLLPRGVMAYAQVIVDQTGISSVTDLTGMSATWTATSSRVYRITVAGEVTATAADGAFVVSLTDTSNVLVKRATDACLTTSSRSFGIIYRVTGLSGSITRKVRLNKAGGTGTLTFGTIGATNPGFILVEDIGAA